MSDYREECDRQMPAELAAAILALRDLIPADVDVYISARTVEVTGLGDRVRDFVQGELNVVTERFYGGEIRWAVSYSHPGVHVLRARTLKPPEVDL